MTKQMTIVVIGSLRVKTAVIIFFISRSISESPLVFKVRKVDCNLFLWRKKKEYLSEYSSCLEI